MPDENTSYLKLPLPHPDNLLEGDVFRLRDAFVALDAHSAKVDAELRVKANAADVIAVTNTKADATSTTQALQTLEARISQVAVSVPKLNNTAISTSTTEAATANAVKIARDEARGWANAAQVTATAAQGTANAAQGTANTAVQKADAAQVTANSAGNFAYLMIGSPIYQPTTTLPVNCMWPDGSLALFADWPQFAAKYRAGGFAGMVDNSSNSANLGKFILNSNGTGLYLPRCGGQFMRGYTPGFGTAGAWGRDEIRNITGSLVLGATSFSSASGAFSLVRSSKNNIDTQVGLASLNYTANFSAASGAPTGPENVPPHIRQPVAIYMGAHA